MASSFDGYRSPIIPQPNQQPPFREQDPRDAHHATSAFPSMSPERRDSRPRAGSFRSDAAPESSRYAPVRASAPINEAVSSAFDHANTQSYGVPPNLVAQITEDVIKRLRTAGIDNSNAPGSGYPQPVRTPSGSTSPSMPSRTVYTPPSPHVKAEHSNSFGSPKQQHMPAFASQSPREPRSPNVPQNGFAEQNQGPNSPLKASSTENAPPLKSQSSRMFFYGDIEPTTLDKIWGPLFDPEGKPTARLSQLLRGLAYHIIEEFEPKETIVVTPRKMTKFYDRFKIDHEPYTWSKFFEAHPEDLSDIYCDLECQHHLVQRLHRHSQTPYVPGLTPLGFAKWMTTMLMAHPEEEVERLQKALMDLPIDNPDASKEQERFPKEVSHYLFLKKTDKRELDRIHNAAKFLDDDEDEDFDRRPTTKSTSTTARNQRFRDHAKSMPAAAAAAAAVPIAIPRASSIERERQPYSNVPREPIIDDSNPPASAPQPVPIERERKPYAVQPGVGKTYDENSTPTMPASSVPNPSTDIPHKPAPTRLSRSSSSATQKSDHHPLPAAQESRHVRSGSMANNGQSPGAAGLGLGARRTRSPGYSDGGYRRSGEDVSDRGDRERDGLGQEKRGDWARRQAEEDIRGFEAQRERERERDRDRERDKFMPDVGSPPKRAFDDDYHRNSGARPVGGAGGPGYEYSGSYR
ncbi:MAG: hypothetical protein M1814_006554 [Vezdaea aestivalis]|nr:MAG: hypothetical protein M1814_006554 [Vezdaea aestivalis]